MFVHIFIYIFAICNFQSHWARLLWTDNDEGNNLLCLQCYWHLWSTMWYWFHIIFVLLVLHSWHCYSLVSDISCPRYFPARARSARARRARALRALGLLLADGTPTGGRGEDLAANLSPTDQCFQHEKGVSLDSRYEGTKIFTPCPQKIGFGAQKRPS